MGPFQFGTADLIVLMVLCFCIVSLGLFVIVGVSGCIWSAWKRWSVTAHAQCVTGVPTMTLTGHDGTSPTTVTGITTLDGVFVPVQFVGTVPMTEKAGDAQWRGAAAMAFCVYKGRAATTIRDLCAK